jgi:hypothetical protein
MWMASACRFSPTALMLIQIMTQGALIDYAGIASYFASKLDLYSYSALNAENGD